MWERQDRKKSSTAIIKNDCFILWMGFFWVLVQIILTFNNKKKFKENKVENVFKGIL